MFFQSQFNSWENCNVVSDCLRYYKNESPTFKSECQTQKAVTKEFCAKLHSILAKIVNEKERTKQAIDNIGNVFGKIVSSATVPIQRTKMILVC